MNTQRRKWMLTAVVMLLLLSSAQMTQAESTLADRIPMGPGSTLTVDCPTYLTVRMARDRKSVTIACAPGQSPTATPTSTSTRPPTSIPTQPPTATPVPPTSVPTTNPGPTPTSAGNIQPYASAPLCSTHDNRAYHGLWDYARGCHYDHTHGDDPHAVDDVFGAQVFGYMGGEISYPWHTSAENEEIKHKSYLWLVERDLPCESQFSSGCIRHYRAFVHNDLHNIAATHHSALIEAWVCDEARYPTEGEAACGRFLVSGHHATGDLIIDETVVLDRPEPDRAPRPQMLHYDTVGNKNFATWYPVFGAWMRVSTEVGDMFGYYPMPSGPLPVASASSLQFVPLGGNASRVQPHVMSVGMPANLGSVLDPDRNGFVDYNGFLDVHTAEFGDCVAVSEHCAPLVMEHVPVVPGIQFQHRGSYKEFDIFFNGQSSGWIVFPGFVR